MGALSNLGQLGHLGDRVSALLDGQLSAEETERAWQHVHTCHLCRDLVEREGWVKTRLAGLSQTDVGMSRGMPPGDVLLAMAQGSAGGDTDRGGRRTAGLVMIGGGALGAAMMGVLALGAAPAAAPSIDRRAPATQLAPGTSTPVLGPARLRPGGMMAP